MSSVSHGYRIQKVEFKDVMGDLYFCLVYTENNALEFNIQRLNLSGLESVKKVNTRRSCLLKTETKFDRANNTETLGIG